MSCTGSELSYFLRQVPDSDMLQSSSNDVRHRPPAAKSYKVLGMCVALLFGPAWNGIVKASAAETADASLSSRDKKATPIDFAREVHPLLEQYCYPCHSEKKKGGIDFRVYPDQVAALQ